METFAFFFVGFSGLAWTIVYISLIYVGFKEKTYGMPFVALALNIAWEVIYTINGLHLYPGGIQTWVNILWTIFDFIILFTYFKFGRKHFEDYAKGKYFLSWSFIILIMAFVIQYGFYIEFDMATSSNLALVKTYVDPDLGAWYSAFLQNLIMSVLFIVMLVLRKSTQGQTMIIAVAKWLGTLAPTILFGIILENKLVFVAGVFCSVFDIIYIWLLLQYKKGEEIY